MKQPYYFSLLLAAALFLITSCGDSDSGPTRVKVNKIFWYAYNEEVPQGGTSPFAPTALLTENYDITVQSESQQSTVPSGYDVIVLADNFSGEFDLSAFTGSVIVTFDSGVEAMMKDFFGGNGDNSYQQGKYWDYNTGATLTWIKPTLDAEDCQEGDALVYKDSLVNDFKWLIRRNNLVEATSFDDPDSEADVNSDAVIIYELKSGSGSKVKYWIQIGPLDSDYADRACEVLKLALDKIAK